MLVRKTLAAVAGEVGHICAGEVEAFLAEATLVVNASGDVDTTMSVNQKQKRTKKIAGRVIAVAVSLVPERYCIN